MLVSFSVSNFRSFGEEQTLNLVASNRLTDHSNHLVPIGSTGKHLLRSAVIYGANAAGKSNLIRAMGVAQQMILERGSGFASVEPFRFDRDKVGQPSTFEFRVLLGDQVFVYGFDATNRNIVCEWLSVLKDDDELTIFERNNKGETTTESRTKRQFPDDTTMFDTLGKLAQLPLTGRQLFLSRILSLPEVSQGKTLKSIIRWLTRDLVVLGTEHRASDIVSRLSSDPHFRAFSSRFLKSVGTGIGDLGLLETTRNVSEHERQYFAQLRKAGIALSNAFGRTDVDMQVNDDDPDHVIERRLLAKHDLASEDFPLPFSEESDGTQQLLHLMPVLFHSEENRIVVIDELDRSLHPHLCWEFIRFFSETRPGERKQLIVTTHEAHLLNQDLLRRDEYWFVEKDAAQQSRLTSLLDFNIRNDLHVEKGYLQGRFGAIPVIGPMGDLERLLDFRGSEAIHAAQEAPLDRDSGVVRDASLIVIASEDTYAVRDYFSRFRTRRVQFVIIPTAHGQSAPANVIVRLDNFKDDTATEEDDQFWLCIDKDHWANSGHIANLAQVLQHCAQKRYQVAISNPCFELWLLLHFEDVGPTDQRTCRQIARRLSELAGGYTKKHCGLLPLNETMVKDAVKRAQSLDTSTSLIPDAQSTGVYRIIAALQAKDAIDLT